MSGAGVRQAYIYSGVNPALYPQHGVYPQPQHIHGTHPGYNQPPPNIPNQHPRPQTPPSAATATVNPTGAPGGHSINITTPQGIYINQTPQTPHYAQQQTTQPPPQVSVASQPNPVAHTTYPSVMQPTQSKPPLEKRKRNPIQIIDPNTMKEVAVSDGPSKSSSVAASEAKPSENDEVPEVRSNIGILKCFNSIQIFAQFSIITKRPHWSNLGVNTHYSLHRNYIDFLVFIENFFKVILIRIHLRKNVFFDLEKF